MQKGYYSPNEMMQVYVLTLIQESGNESLEDLMKFIREEKKFGTGQLGYNNTSRFLKKIKELKPQRGHQILPYTKSNKCSADPNRW